MTHKFWAAVVVYSVGVLLALIDVWIGVGWILGALVADAKDIWRWLRGWLKEEAA